MSGGGANGRACIFGEVLFDRFPDGRRVLGGAPFNVAWHLRAFGEDPYLVSRVGDDEDGAAVRAAMRAWGMDEAGLQTDPRLPTGRVQVTIEAGEPAYDIVCPAAWDAIEAPTRERSGSPPCALLYHGSLALRSGPSRRACQSLREAGPGTVFVDVNLRPPWWDRERVLEPLQRGFSMLTGGLECLQRAVLPSVGEYVLATRAGPFKFTQIIAPTGQKSIRINARPGGDRHCEQHTCHGGVNTGLENCHPQPNAQHGIHQGVAHSQHPGRDQRHQDRPADRQADP